MSKLIIYKFSLIFKNKFFFLKKMQFNKKQFYQNLLGKK